MTKYLVIVRQANTKGIVVGTFEKRIQAQKFMNNTAVQYAEHFDFSITTACPDFIEVGDRVWLLVDYNFD